MTSLPHIPIPASPYTLLGIVGKKIKAETEDAETLSPEKERLLAEKLERKRQRDMVRAHLTIKTLQSIADSIREEVIEAMKLPNTTKVRYEPRAHKKNSWLEPMHYIIVRHDGGSKSFRFSFDGDDESFRKIVRKDPCGNRSIYKYLLCQA